MSSRPYIVQEANLVQLRSFRPNLAVLPWGATEAHNLHLPHGTDTIQAIALTEAAVARAVEKGARCVLLPAIPFGNNNAQLSQVCTITMRTSTQAAVVYDIAESLVRQGIDRLVIFNFHGGNDFRQIIRDVQLDLPIFIVQINGYQVAPEMKDSLERPGGDHADEFETSVMLHICPQWVAPLEQAGEGATTPFAIPSLKSTPGVWAQRDWAALTKDTGVGNPKAATAGKGQKIFELLVNATAPVLVELSAAKNGDFPFVIRKRQL